MDWIGVAIPQSEPCFRLVGRETGWSLYAAVLLVTARGLLESLLLRLARASGIPAERLWIASAVALPILLAAFLAPHHRRESMKTLRTFESAQPRSRQLAEELIVLRPSLPHGARMRGGHYDAVFTFQHGRLVCTPGPRDARSVPELLRRTHESPTLSPEGGEWSWAGPGRWASFHPKGRLSNNFTSTAHCGADFSLRRASAPPLRSSRNCVVIVAQALGALIRTNDSSGHRPRSKGALACSRHLRTPGRIASEWPALSVPI